MHTNLLPVIRPLGVDGPPMTVLEPDQQVYVRPTLDAYDASPLTEVRVVGIK